MINTTLTGNIGEQIAADYLEENGYTVVERNLKICGCEIDIIATARLDKNGEVIKHKNPKEAFRRLFSKINTRFAQDCGEETLIFCEVKTRLNEEFGSGAEAVTPYKAGRYVTAAKAYTAGKFASNKSVRFDIIEISDEKINHIKNAFDESYCRF